MSIREIVYGTRVVLEHKRSHPSSTEENELALANLAIFSKLRPAMCWHYAMV